MVYNIYREDTVIASVQPVGLQEKGVMNANLVTMSFSLTQPVTFHIGDYVDVYGERYWIFDFAREQKLASNKFNYEIVFKGIQYFLADSNYLFYDSANVLTQGEFSLMANASIFVDLIVANLNRNVANDGWKRGEIDVDPDRYLNLSFSGDNCLQVLAQLAEKFDTEFWVDQDKTIHLKVRDYLNNTTLEYGKDNELYTILREPVQNKIVTRLYVQGGSKNIPGDYRNYSPRLLLPAPVTYIDKNTDIFGIKEDWVYFDDIYPKRIGTITSLGNDIFTFSDSGIDFDINTGLAPGMKAHVVFNSGQLGGLEFEIEFYDHATKTIKLIPNTSEKSLETPNGFMYPRVGDKYTIENIVMPTTYITEAESKLFLEGLKYIEKYSVSEHDYTVTTNKKTFRASAIHIEVGNKVRIVDGDLNLNADLRVISLTRSLQDWYDYTIKLSTLATVPTISRVYNKINLAEKVIRMNDLTNPNLARLNWRTQQQIISMVFDSEGHYYTEKISPIFIETIALQVGTRHQALSLVNVTIQPNYGANPNSLYINPNGILNHFSIEKDAIRVWNMSEFYTNSLVSSSEYYVYAKCDRTGSEGTWHVTADKLTYDHDPNFWYFLIGDLFPVYQGVRDFAFTYGQTYINGRTITTGRIQGLGGTYFDLDTGEIRGRITFTAGSTGYGNIIDAPDAAEIDAMLLAIDNIASDAQLTPNEKQYLLKEVQVIKGERNTVVSQAATFGVSSAAYITAYDQLIAYIDPLLVNLTTTTPVVGSILRTYFKNYYDQKVLLSKAVTDSTKAYTDTLRNSLGALAFESLIGKARLDSTIIDGGYIRTTLLDVQGIRVAGNFMTAADVIASIDAYSYAQGRMLYRDPTFKVGVNGLTAYNNLGNGTVTMDLLPSTALIGITTNPSTSANFIRVRTLGTAQPGLGGVFFGNTSRPSARFITRIIARIPVGFEIHFGTNPIGNGGVQRWATSQAGTGDWAEYLSVVVCGATGTFSSTNFYYLTHPSATTVEWYISSATVYDVTDAEIDYISNAATQSIAAREAAVALSYANDNLKEITTKAYADGQVDIEEARAIADAQNKLAIAQADATAKANAAYTSATQYADGTYNASINWADTRVQNLQNTLGGLAYTSLVRTAMENESIIIGGYISTVFIDTIWLKAQVINVNYIEGLTLNFIRGSIGNWSIGNNLINSGGVWSQMAIQSGVDPKIAMSTFRDQPPTPAQASGGTSGGGLGSVSISELSPENITINSAGRQSPATFNYSVATFALRGASTGMVRIALEALAPVNIYDLAILCQGKARFDNEVQIDGITYINSNLRIGQSATITVYDGATPVTGFTGTANFIKFRDGICIGPA